MVPPIRRRAGRSTSSAIGVWVCGIDLLGTTITISPILRSSGETHATRLRRTGRLRPRPVHEGRNPRVRQDTPGRLQHQAVAYDPGWPQEFRALAPRLQTVLGSLAQSIDHIGSTAVPGVAAKDCIGIQIRVDDLNDKAIPPAFDTIDFRLRPEPWNRVEVTAGKRWPKLAFAPPIGERASNVHVRETTSATAQRNLQFRDFLRADDPALDAWGDFKQRLAHSATNLYDYGKLKSPATEILMITAEDWARRTAWTRAR